MFDQSPPPSSPEERSKLKYLLSDILANASVNEPIMDEYLFDQTTKLIRLAHEIAYAHINYELRHSDYLFSPTGTDWFEESIQDCFSDWSNIARLAQYGILDGVMMWGDFCYLLLHPYKTWQDNLLHYQWLTILHESDLNQFFEFDPLLDLFESAKNAPNIDVGHIIARSFCENPYLSTFLSEHPFPSQTDMQDSIPSISLLTWIDAEAIEILDIDPKKKLLFIQSATKKCSFTSEGCQNKLTKPSLGQKNLIVNSKNSLEKIASNLHLFESKQVLSGKLEPFSNDIDLFNNLKAQIKKEEELVEDTPTNSTDPYEDTESGRVT